MELIDNAVLTPGVNGFHILYCNELKIFYLYNSIRDGSKSYDIFDSINIDKDLEFIVNNGYDVFEQTYTTGEIPKPYHEALRTIKNQLDNTNKSYKTLQQLLGYLLTNNFNQSDVLSELDDIKNSNIIRRINELPGKERAKEEMEEIEEEWKDITHLDGFIINTGDKIYPKGLLEIPLNKDGSRKTHMEGKETVEDEPYLIARILLDNITMVNDGLKTFEKVYNISYYNLVSQQQMEFNHLTRDELAAALYRDMCFIGYDERAINSKISNLIVRNANIEYKGNTIIKSTTDIFKDGFYFIDGEVVSNNLLNDIEPTKENVRIAINLVNELITSRGTAKGNECNVLRFMLSSPFSWIFKEIGMSKANYGLVLEGEPGTNKTGSVMNFSYFYSIPDNIIQTADTVSAFGTRLEESTLPLMIDESRHLFDLPGMEEIQKRTIWNKNTRSTKKRTGNNNDMDNFIALRMPIYAVNNPPQFKGEFLRRHKVNSYDKSMIISEEEELAFIKKFKPGSPSSPLINLKYLGKAFFDKIKPYIESGSDELYDIEKLTVKLLKEISEWCDTAFAPSIYHIQESSESLEIDLYSLIQRELSQEFRKLRRYRYGLNEYQEDDFILCADNNEISWLHHITTKDGDDVFAIDKKQFEFYISEICNKKMTADSILELMEIELQKNINTNGFNTKFYKGKTRTGFKLTPYQLCYKLFGIEVMEHKDLIQAEMEELEKEFNEQ